MEYGKWVTATRKAVRERAEQAVIDLAGDAGHSQEQIREAIKKIGKRRSTREPKDGKLRAHHFRGEPALKQRRRLRGRKGRLSISEKVSVVHSILCQGEYQPDVA